MRHRLSCIPFALLLVATPSAAAIPTGWSLASTIDGGTSSLGSSIATTDALAVVGAPLAAAAGGGAPTGAVFVYSGSAGSWTPQVLSAPAPVANGNFGTSVAASGNLIAIGAGGTPPAAYVFAADGGSYTSAQTWTDPASDTNGSFGSSIAVFAGTAGTSYVAVAAPGASGTVYVSRTGDGGAWSNPPVALTDPAAESFGIAVAFAGDGELLIGDPGTGPGQVLRYAPLPDGGWESQGTLDFALDGGSVAQFGDGLATWGSLAVVTAPGSSNDAGTYNGAAFVFATDDAGVWTQQAVLTGAAAESFANFAPAVNGALIAVGSAINTASSGAGQVDVWAQSGGAWVSVPAATLVGDSYYGQAVGLAAGALFIGDTSAAGAASVNDVKSSLAIEMPTYADAAPADATTPTNDASAAADGSPTTPEDSSAPPAGSDAASGQPGAPGGPTSASSGCGCSSAGAGAGSGLAAILAGWACAGLARARRRERR